MLVTMTLIAVMSVASSPLQDDLSSGSQLSDTTIAEWLKAAGTGDLRRMSEFLDAEPRLLNIRFNTAGPTALGTAAANDKIYVVLWLLERGAPVDQPGRINDSPLTEAAANGHAGIVGFLLARGAAVNGGNRQRYTSLQRAVRGEHWSVADLLLKKGAALDIGSAAALGNREEVERQYASHVAEDNPLAPDPLTWAARAGRSDVVRWLVAQPEYDSKESTRVMLALSGAASRDHVDVLEILLEHGFDPNTVALGVDPAILVAAREGCVAAFKRLLAAGADPTLEGRKPGHNALTAAVGDGFTFQSEMSRYFARMVQHEELVDLIVSLKDDERIAAHLPQMLRFAEIAGHDEVIRKLRPFVRADDVDGNPMNLD